MEVTPQITLIGTKSDQIGYGRMALEIGHALRSQGMEVFDSFSLSDSADFADQPWSGENAGLSNVTVWCTFPSHARGWYEDQHVALMTMFETDYLPDVFRENIEEFDQVIVPSWQNQRLFSSFHDDVQFVPLGIDPLVWHYTPRITDDRFFWFMTAGSGARKGADLTVRAFRKLFPYPEKLNPIPRLLLKTPRIDSEINDVYIGGPNIDVLGGRCALSEEVDLYASVHCYVAPSRGEGFGLQPLQAMAQGIPTILTNAHGHESFAHLGIGVPSELVPAGYFSLAGEGRAGRWWEPDFDYLCGVMEHVYRNYDAELDRAKESSVKVMSEWTWDQSATKLRHAIGEEKLSTPYSGSGIWHKPENKLYQVVVQRLYAGHGAGVYMILEPGRVYYEPADVKRQLFEAGYLDPCCLESTAAEPGMFMDAGLTEDQVAKIGGYRAEHSWCPMCGQQLGSAPTKADLLYEEMGN